MHWSLRLAYFCMRELPTVDAVALASCSCTCLGSAVLVASEAAAHSTNSPAYSVLRPPISSSELPLKVQKYFEYCIFVLHIFVLISVFWVSELLLVWYFRTYETLSYTSDVEFAGSQRMWMLLTIFVALPCTTWVYFHAKAVEEEEAHRPRPEFVPYAHLRLRSKVVSLCEYMSDYTFLFFSLLQFLFMIFVPLAPDTVSKALFSVRPGIRLSSQLLLLWYLMNALNNFDKNWQGWLH